MKRTVVGLLGSILFGLVLLPVVAQQSETAPLTENDIIILLQQGNTSDEVARLVRERGISFRVTPELEEKLGILKAEPVLYEALKAPARLEIRSNAAGAEVKFDGEPRGQIPADAPLVLEGLAGGEHVVQLASPAHVGLTESVFLKPGENRQVTFDLVGAVSSRPGPLGARVDVQAGTGPDLMLSDIDFASDLAEKVRLTQKLIDEYADTPAALLGYQMLQDFRLQQQQYDAALAAGAELLKRDPKNFKGLARQVMGYLGKGQLEEALNFAQRATELLDEVKALPAPEGKTPEAWEQEKQKLVQSTAGELAQIDYDLYFAATQVSDAQARIAFLERYVQLFPESNYAPHARVAITFAYQQQGNTAKMLEWANRVLQADPDNAPVLVLASDVLSEGGRELNRAQELASHLITLLKEEPEKARPEGMSDEQWAQQQKVWQGFGYSSLGQVFLHREKTVEAIEQFRAATPLLKGEKMAYARNLYRLGFALAKIGGRENMEFARDVLTELVRLGTPYAPPAQDLLAKVNQALAGRRRP